MQYRIKSFKTQPFLYVSLASITNSILSMKFTSIYVFFTLLRINTISKGVMTYWSLEWRRNECLLWGRNWNYYNIYVKINTVFFSFYFSLTSYYPQAISITPYLSKPLFTHWTVRDKSLQDQGRVNKFKPLQIYSVINCKIFDGCQNLQCRL